jgi:transcriptional regulator with XRE-family HTH domain
MSVFSERLREMRKLRGVTQKALATHLGISENAYQNYEYGKREPNYKTLAELCRVLEVSADYLIGVGVNSRE